MTRSPLAYPLNRSADMDVGGAADLQTDIMRFMAILSLCLVAIFALVQSIPLTPVEPVPGETAPAPAPAAVAQESVQAAPEPAPTPTPMPSPLAVEKAVTLTRPAWQPKRAPQTPARDEPVVVTQAVVTQAVAAPAPPEPEQKEFTLRFASDAALTRAVAAHHVGLYALDTTQARRMTVSESRISFWDASTPNTFHEMDASTVPAAVIDALARTGVATDGIGWGVTLPGKVRTQLDSLMQDHDGGSLIINAAGDVHWEEQ
ncbi:MAG: hypothetical protein WBM45_08460 [Woeseiaceae bacterium]